MHLIFFWGSGIHSSYEETQGLEYCNCTAMHNFTSGELSCPYQRTDNAYPRYLDTVINDVKNEVDCEVKCTFYENFVCRSFAYYSSARQCFVSGDDTGKKRLDWMRMKMLIWLKASNF